MLNKISTFLVIGVTLLLISNSSFAQRRRPQPTITFSYANLFGDDSFSSQSYMLSPKIPIFSGRWMILNNFGFNYAKTDRSSNHYFEEDVYDINYMFFATNQKMSIMGFVGSASDKPFHSLSDTKYGGGIFFNVLKSGGHTLDIGAAYFDKELVDGWFLPMPFFTYRYVSQKFIVSLGMRNFVVWKMMPFLVFKAEFNFSGEEFVELAMYFSKKDKIALRGGLETREYAQADREMKDEDIRFQYYFTGIEYERRFLDSLKFSIFAGYSFEGEYYRQQRTDLITSEYRHDKTSIPNSWLLKLSLSALF